MDNAIGWALAALALVATLCTSRPATAQGAPSASVARMAVSVEYVGSDGLYLAVGSDQGAARGDTVRIYAGERDSDPRGRLVFTSVTRRRAVAVMLDPSTRLQPGEVIFIPLVPPASAEAPPAAAAAQEEPLPRRSTLAPEGPRISGRLSLDVEARETLTSWSGDLFGETRRRFATPTSRLSLRVSDLPGGIAVQANVRASYRYDELQAGPSPVSVRAYELAASKSFERFPVAITLGRFSNPHERYSAYWDGVLIRVGRTSGLGAGVAAGFEPELHNERFSRARPKLTAFADFAARGATWRYDTDASFHVARPSGAAERRFVGWSQQLTVGGLTLSQRLRVDGNLDATRWSLTELRLRGGLELLGPLRLRSTVRRSSSLPTSLPLAGRLPSGVRREVTVGLDVSAERGYASIEAGRTERDDSEPGRSLYGSAAVRPTGAVQLLLSARRWDRGRARSWSIAPAVSLRLTSWDWRAGYRLYRTTDGARVLGSQSVEGQVGVTLVNATRLAVRGERQWGPSLSGTRLQLSLWRSF